MKGLRQSVLELDTHVPADIYNDQLAQTNMIAGMKFCGERGKDLDAFLPPIYASGNADREGKFSLVFSLGVILSTRLQKLVRPM